MSTVLLDRRVEPFVSCVPDAVERCPVVVGGVELWPVERLETALVSWSAREAVVKARLLEVLGEFVRREAWKPSGCLSAGHWLSIHCGLGRVAASEHLRVAAVLPRLALVRAALAEGRLSWSKVREITRVIDPDVDEAAWLEVALGASANQVARLVASFRRLTPADAERLVAQRSFSAFTDVDGSMVITLRLPPEVGAAVVNAVRKATTPVKGQPIAALHADTAVAVLVGQGPLPTQVVLHGDIGLLAGDPAARGWVAGGGAVPAVVVAEACCTSPVMVMAHDHDGPVAVTDTRRLFSAPQRAAMAARDGGRCAFPGCDVGHDLEAHHVIAHGRLGPTAIANGALMCGSHHRFLHRNGLALRRVRPGAYDVVHDDGRPWRTTPIVDPALVEADPCGDPRAGWWGGNFDYDHVLTALGGLRPIT